MPCLHFFGHRRECLAQGRRSRMIDRAELLLQKSMSLEFDFLFLCHDFPLFRIHAISFSVPPLCFPIPRAEEETKKSNAKFCWPRPLKFFFPKLDFGGNVSRCTPAQAHTSKFAVVLETINFPRLCFAYVQTPPFFQAGNRKRNR